MYQEPLTALQAAAFEDVRPDREEGLGQAGGPAQVHAPPGTGRQCAAGVATYSA